MRYAHFLIFPLLLFPSSVFPGLHDYLGEHLNGTKALWDTRMGNYTPDELDSFVKATWQGTDGNVKVCRALSAISILECGDKRDVRDRTGHLGGHRKTIRTGAKECKIEASTPYLKTVALSHHFLFLYYHYGEDLEKTCRVWNKGPAWTGDLAGKYWRGVESFSRIYDRGRIETFEMAQR